MSKTSGGEPKKPRPKKRARKRVAKKKVGGRPSRYRAEFAEQAMKLCRLGATDVELADFFEVADSTISKWKVTHRRFSEALKEGKSAADAEVASKLFKRATGYSHTDTKFATHEGKITDAKEYTKHYAPDTIACIFWLKNRRPDLWRDKIGHEHSGPNGGPIKQESDFTVTLEDEAVIARMREKRESIKDS